MSTMSAQITKAQREALQGMAWEQRHTATDLGVQQRTMQALADRGLVARRGYTPGASGTARYTLTREGYAAAQGIAPAKPTAPQTHWVAVERQRSADVWVGPFDSASDAEDALTGPEVDDLAEVDALNAYVTADVPPSGVEIVHPTGQRGYVVAYTSSDGAQREAHFATLADASAEAGRMVYALTGRQNLPVAVDTYPVQTPDGVQHTIRVARGGAYAAPADSPEVTGAWVSPNGSIVSAHVLARVDMAVLADMYAAEARGDVVLGADSATTLAFRYGYANPRTASGRHDLATHYGVVVLYDVHGERHTGASVQDIVHRRYTSDAVAAYRGPISADGTGRWAVYVDGAHVADLWTSPVQPVDSLADHYGVTDDRIREILGTTGDYVTDAQADSLMYRDDLNASPRFLDQDSL